MRIRLEYIGITVVVDDKGLMVMLMLLRNTTSDPSIKDDSDN